MSYEFSNHDEIFTGAAKSKSPTVEIEVILHDKTPTHLIISEDETAGPRDIPRAGIRIRKGHGAIVVLEMTERKALALDLL